MQQFTINTEHNNNIHQQPQNIQILLVEIQLIYDDKNIFDPAILIAQAKEGKNCKTVVHRISADTSYDQFITIINIERDYSKQLRLVSVTQWINQLDINQPQSINWLQQSNNILLYENNKLHKGTKKKKQKKK